MSDGWVPTQYQQAEATKRAEVVDKRSTPKRKPAKGKGGLLGFVKRSRANQKAKAQTYTGADFKPGRIYNVHWFNSWQDHENRLVGARCQKLDQHGVLWFTCEGRSKYIRPESITYMKEVS